MSTQNPVPASRAEGCRDQHVCSQCRRQQHPEPSSAVGEPAAPVGTPGPDVPSAAVESNETASRSDRTAHGIGAAPQQPVLACVSCGRELPEDASFCPGCGQRTGPDGDAPFRVVRDKTGEESPLSDSLVIGCDDGCDLVLAGDGYVSRKHARLHLDDGLVWVEDLGSSNGTLLRIRRSIVVEPGDELLIGATVLRLEKSER